MLVSDEQQKEFRILQEIFMHVDDIIFYEQAIQRAHLKHYPKEVVERSEKELNLSRYYLSTALNELRSLLGEI